MFKRPQSSSDGGFAKRKRTTLAPIDDDDGGSGWNAHKTPDVPPSPSVSHSMSPFPDIDEVSMRDRSVAAVSSQHRSGSNSRGSRTSSREARGGVVRSDASSGNAILSSSVHLADEDELMPVPAAAAAPARPVGAPGANASPACPICCEQFRIFYDDNRPQENSSAAAGPKKSLTRVNKARTTLQSEIADRYRVIFGLESVLSGMSNDDVIFELMLSIHRISVEKLLRVHGIAFTPWTMQALRDHYSPANEHVIDPIREARHDVRLTRKAISMLSLNNFLMEDDDNPGRLVVDHKSIRAFSAMSTHKMKLLESLHRLQHHKHADLSGAVFALTSAVRNQAGDGALEIMRDARMAAGTVAQGGDALRTANAQANKGASNLNKISGY